MRRLVGLVVLLAAAFILSVGSMASLIVAGGALLATRESSACVDESVSPIELAPHGSQASTEPAPTVGQSEHWPTPALCPGPPTGGTAIDPSMVPAADAQAAVAVAAALSAVGRGGRYVAEGNGPVNFDCSGLTAWAWRQAGVSLVDYSYTQRAQTIDVPRALVQPGDLVFWFGGAEHHVAIVTAVSGGQITIAEAANPTAGVRVRQLGGGWDHAYLTGFGRVMRG